MKKNIGATDLVIRILLMAALAIALISGMHYEKWMLFIAVCLTLSIFTKYSFIYHMFGISTRKPATNRPFRMWKQTSGNWGF